MVVTRRIRRRRIRHHSSSEGDGNGSGSDDCGGDGDDHCDIMASTVLLLRQSSSSPSRSILLSLVLIFLFTTTTTCTGQGTGTGIDLSSSSSSSSSSLSQSELDSIAEASIAYSIFRKHPMCFTGPSQAVTLNEATGELNIISSAVINNDDNDNDYDSNRNRNRNLRRGGLRHQQFLRTSSTDSSLNDFSMIVQKTNPAMIHHRDRDRDRDRGLSLDGSNSLTFTSSGNGNQDDINNNTKVFYARECSCYGDNNNNNNNDQNNDNKKIALFCDEESDYCGLSLSADGQQKVECYTVSKLDTLTRNIWPLIWILYCLVLLSCLCTFHGRIVLDFIKGTILYYCCGFGDRFGNRSLRSVNRYNYSIVQEILDEERYDRSQVLRTRRDGTTQAAQQMDAIANAAGGATTAANNNNNNNAAAVSADVPPTTIMTNNSIEMDNIVEDVDEEEEQQEDVSAAAAATTSTGMLSRFGNYVNNIEWPWQHSWKRYIRYNLLMRVEWIAQRDEVAFINSRQQRGLPHARYEMKIRKWNSQEGCTNAGGCSIVGGSLAQFSHCSSLNSVDEPHCTICFSELEDGDRVGDIGCMHVFHADCLKMWIQKRNSCPLCNIPVAKRRRISSEELNKEAIDKKEANTNNDNAAAAALLLLQEERDINSGSGTTANTSLAASNHLANHQHDDTDNYNYSIPVVSGDALQPMDGATTNMPPTRQRLLHMPMTPSTLAAEDSYDSYSSYSDEYEMNDGMIDDDDDDDDNSSIGGVNGSPSSSGFTVSNDRKQSIDDGEMTDDVEVKDDDDIDVVDDGNNHEKLQSPDNTSAPDAAVDKSRQQEQDQQQQPNLKFLQFQGSHLQSPPRQIRQRRSSSSTTRPQNSTNNNILTGHDGAVVGMDDGVQHENENEEEEEDDGNEENVDDDNDISLRSEEQREGEDDDLHHLEEDTNDGDEETEEDEEQQ